MKTQWGKLTDSDLDQIEGQSEKLIGVIQTRSGYAREKAEQEVADFKAALDDLDDAKTIH